MKKIVLLVFVFLFISLTAKPQLSGTYTIGGNSPDYLTISDATTALTNLGISGPVVFNLRNGIYSEQILLTQIAGNSSINTITFQSESADSSTVKITSSQNSTFEIDNGAFYIIFKDLSIENNTGGNAVRDYTYSSSIKILHCTVRSQLETIRVYGGLGIYLTDCCIHSIVNVGLTLTSGCVFECPLSIQQTYGTAFTFGAGNVLRNSFRGSIELGNVVFNANQVYTGGITSSYCNSLVIKNNTIHYDSLSNGAIDLWFCNNAQIINNELNGSVGLGSSNHCVISRNKLHSGFNITWCDYIVLKNNFFFTDTTHPYVDLYLNQNATVLNNNFSPDITLTCSNPPSVYENNIFPRKIYYQYGVTYSNNNYLGSPIPWDTNPYNLNPNYIDTLADLHTTNPILIGRGVHSPSVLIDIDSLTRPHNPSIGANEICISVNSFNLQCGDSIPLVFCSPYNNQNLMWTPTNGLNFFTFNSPKASPQASTTYFATDTTNGNIDSIRINIVSFQVSTSPDTLLNCGDSILLDASLNAGVIYQWLPATGLNNPNIRRPIAKPLQTTTYTVTAINSTCGNTVDSIKISVNPLPQVNYYINSITGLTVGFLNLSTCADTYLWNFGDGDTLSTINPTHTYLQPGNYIITLIACNSYGCDTIVYSLYINNTGLTEHQASPSFSLYPNPTTSLFNISFNEEQKNSTIKILNVLGEITFQSTINSKQTTIDISALPQGIYFVEITTADKQVMRSKVIKE